MRLTSPCHFLSLILLAACGGKDPATTDSSPSSSTGENPSTGAVDPTSGGNSSTGVVVTSGTDSSVSGTSTSGVEPVTTAGPTTTTGEPCTTTATSTTTTTGEPGTTTGGDSSSGDTGAVPGGECVSDADCVLHNDCCDCFAVAKVDDPPICKKGCDEPLCDQLQIDQVSCRFGVCVTEKLPCDASKVACDALPPDCPEGQVTTVAGACWSGLCVPAISCDVVESCALCPEGFMCVFHEVQIPKLPTCEPIPAPCAGKIDCDCAGAEVCVDPFDGCNDLGPNNELHCSCPAC